MSKNWVYEAIVQTNGGTTTVGHFSKRRDAMQVIDSVLREIYPDIEFERDGGYFIMKGTGPSARWFGLACAHPLNNTGTTVALARGAVLFGPNKGLIEDMKLRQAKFANSHPSQKSQEVAS